MCWGHPKRSKFIDTNSVLDFATDELWESYTRAHEWVLVSLPKTKRGWDRTKLHGDHFD